MNQIGRDLATILAEELGETVTTATIRALEKLPASSPMDTLVKGLALDWLKTHGPHLAASRIEILVSAMSRSGLRMDRVEHLGLSAAELSEIVEQLQTLESQSRRDSQKWARSLAGTIRMISMVVQRAAVIALGGVA